MYSNKRASLRQLFYSSWEKFQNNLPLEMLENQIVEIILHHPEYHTLLMQPDCIEYESNEGSNPFLHLSLHLALKEQISTNRPQGISKLYHQLCAKKNPHQAEHLMISCLEKILWEAQEKGSPPNEGFYLDQLNKAVLREK